MLTKEVNRSPCKWCEKRHIGCHTICVAYKKYRKRQDEILEERNARNDSTPDMPRKIKQRIWREMRRR